MKKIYLLLLLLSSVCSFAQNPLLIKTVTSTGAEPENNSDAYGTNHTWNGKIFYQAKSTTPAINLAVTDGTAAGTIFLKNIGGGSGIYAGISQMVAAQNFIYISTLTYLTSFSTAKYELWRSDGTAAGTILLKSFDVTTTSQVMPIANFAAASSQRVINVVGDVLYFAGYDAVNGNELWKSDGTAAGTAFIKDIKAGSSGSFPQGFCRVGSKILFTATAVSGFGDLWQTDGTDAGTTVVKDFSPGNNSFGTSGGFGSALFKGKMYFYASEPATGTELWSTDGSDAGTSILIDANPGPATSLPSIQQSLTLMQDSNYLYFVTRLDNTSPYHVWRTNGTTGGTIQLTTAANAIYNSNGVSGSLNAYPTDNGVYYVSYADSLYKTNGTVAGTVRVEKKLYVARGIFAYKNAAWFIARATNNSDNEPWRSDGLAANTGRALDIYPGVVSGLAYSSSPFGYFELNNFLYFFANNASGRHLFRYNGDMTFNGAVAGSNWRDSANWNSLMPPGITDTVYINAGAMPTVDGSKAYAGTLIMQSGSSVNLNAATDTLFINNNLQGTSATGNGIIALTNFSGDTARLSSSFSAVNLNVNSVASLAGNLTVSNNLNLTGAARLIANSSNVILTGSTSAITNSANSYIVTNGTGKLQIQKIGTGGRTGTVVFPVGSLANYNPVTFSNTGTMDVYGVRSAPGLKKDYAGETPVGSNYSTGAVNNTWFVTEGTPGGSNATITLQWNGLQELPTFNRAQSQFGHYTSGAWQLGSIAAATGSDPYTFTGSGITTFSPFSVFNSGAVLPISSALLSVVKVANGQQLTWTIITTNGETISVERSVNGIVFTTVSNQTFNTSGSYTDTYNAGANKVFYRIKITHQDGRTVYTNTVFIELKGKAEITVYPTIFNNQFAIQNNAAGSQRLQLYEQDGKLALDRSVATGTTIIQAANLLPGVYIYRIFNATGHTEGRIVKQ